MKIEDLTKELYNLNRSIKEITTTTGFYEWENLEEVEADKDNPEQLLLLEEYKRVIGKLDEVNRALDYLKRPITIEGELLLQNNGRYTIGDTELTSGKPLEVLIYDEYEELYRWLASRIESNSKGYYIVGYDGVINGLKARIRG